MREKRTNRAQQGVMLVEALIAILIFSIGILAMVAMQGLAIGYSADAKYRSDASFLANEIIGQMWVDRANLGGYVHPGGTAPGLEAWVARVNEYLPGSTGANLPTIAVDAATGVVEVTIRWQLPGADSARNYRAVSLIANP